METVPLFGLSTNLIQDEGRRNLLSVGGFEAASFALRESSEGVLSRRHEGV
jgi:hypothetical protein